MAEEKDIQQNIILNYKTNALNAAKEVDSLNSAYENVNDEKVRGTNETKKEEQAYKSMKTQIREATQDLIKMSQTYGETSKQAIEAAKKVAELKDQVGFANDLVEGFNPDRKFQGMATAVNAAAVAASGVTSGMALMGAESEDTEKALLKVQAAMAFSDAVGRITEMGDDFMKLQAQVSSMFTTLTTAKAVDTAATEANNASKAKGIVITEGAAVASTALGGGMTFNAIATTAAAVATNLFNAALAILASPILLVVAGIAALVLGIGYLTGAFGDFSGEAAKAEQANKKLSGEIDKLTKANEKSNEQMRFSADAAIAMAKAQGKSTDEVRKLKEELINQEVVEKRLNALKAQSILIEAQRVAGLEDATDAQKETAKKAWEFFKKTNEDYNSSLKARRQMAIDHKVEIVAEETAKNKELAEKRAEAAKKEADERKRKHEEELKEKQKLKEDLKKLEERYVTDIENLKDKSDEQKLQRQKERDLEEIETLRKKGEDVTNLLKLNDEKYAILTEELRIKRAEEKAVKDKEEQDKINAEIQKQLEDQQVIEVAMLEQKEAIEDKKIEIASKGVQLLAGVFGKSKAMQKAAIIAENAIGIGKMIIDNNRANVGALATPQAIATSGASAAPTIAFNNISTGIGVASSIAATAKALAAVGGGGSAGGGGGSTGGSTPSGGSAPQVGFQNSSENQIATAVTDRTADAPPIQAFVVSSEVTTAQALDRNRVEANSF